jgi:hypothetical protein
VKAMLFRKKIKRSCEYCQFGTQIDEENILCTKKGQVSLWGSCRRFRYDPTKRIPPKARAMDFAKYQEEDYTL